MQSDGCDTVPELTLLTPVRVKVRVHIDFDVYNYKDQSLDKLVGLSQR